MTVEQLMNLINTAVNAKPTYHSTDTPPRAKRQLPAAEAVAYGNATALDNGDMEDTEPSGAWSCLRCGAEHNRAPNKRECRLCEADRDDSAHAPSPPQEGAAERSQRLSDEKNEYLQRKALAEERGDPPAIVAVWVSKIAEIDSALAPADRLTALSKEEKVPALHAKLVAAQAHQLALQQKLETRRTRLEELTRDAQCLEVALGKAATVVAETQEELRAAAQAELPPPLVSPPSIPEMAPVAGAAKWHIATQARMESVTATLQQLESKLRTPGDIKLAFQAHQAEQRAGGGDIPDEALLDWTLAHLLNELQPVAQASQDTKSEAEGLRLVAELSSLTSGQVAAAKAAGKGKARSDATEPYRAS